MASSTRPNIVAAAAAAKQAENLSSPTTEGPPDFQHGHFFSKKTFHKPTYCHHCTDMLWGLIGQGFICEVCNFVVHDRCMKTVVSPCSTMTTIVLKNPVPHCWSEPGHLKRRFCNVCRKRIEDSCAVRCEVCEYCVHVECQDFGVADCKECATYVPSRDLPSVTQYHHWREGNLPPNSKCQHCKKTCWSAECLSGMRCEWCGVTAHPSCYKSLCTACTFGCLESIMLPPACVSIPRTDVPLETIIGAQVKKREALSPRSISEEFSSSGDMKSKDYDEYLSQKDKEEEIIKVYDGNGSMKSRMFRTISITRTATKEQIIENGLSWERQVGYRTESAGGIFGLIYESGNFLKGTISINWKQGASLRAFHIYDDPKLYYITDALDNEKEVDDPTPVLNLTRRDGQRPSIFLRFRPPDPDCGFIKVYPGKLGALENHLVIPVTSDTEVDDVMIASLESFGLDRSDVTKYRLSEVSLDKGSVHERPMDNQESPWELLKNIARESIRQKELTRFCLRQKEDLQSSSVALFVGNLQPNQSQKQYEMLLLEMLGKPYKFREIGPIYYEYGSLIITYDNADIAVKAFYILRETTFDGKNPLVLLLPNLLADMVPPGIRPLLVFVNVKSGGCQGMELISSFRRFLNPYQVYDLENGGPLPGLYVFRHIRDYKILVCGGDGTVGWVLQCLDNVGQDSECQSPPCAILPLGTGNDLARVLRWGPGYTGGEEPLSILKDVIDAEEIRLDRWTVVFHTDDKSEDKPGANAPSGSEDNTLICVMNNYFGIGLDASLCLEFHNAREENPDKFNSRLHNKGVYFRIGISKMVSRRTLKEFHKEVKLEVDGKPVELPQVEGIIILNILSWGSGANPWGSEKEDQFAKPTHYDGMLEVVGVTGVVHMGQIQSGLRSAIRIAQGGHLRIKLLTDMPVQVDGEPWIQSSGEVVVLRSALKATMLKKSKGKMKRRNTEPNMVVSPMEISQDVPSSTGPF